MTVQCPFHLYIDRTKAEDHIAIVDTETNFTRKLNAQQMEVFTDNLLQAVQQLVRG